MARKKRIWFPGAVYHVMSRGIRKTPIYQDRTDYLNFLEVLGNVRDKHPFAIHSLCLMTNHFHMAIETKDTHLSIIMQKLLSIYAGEFNFRHDLHGHVFEGRYTAPLIDSEHYFLEVSRYIHLNPVKAQIVKHPADYKYSSYGLFMSASSPAGRGTQKSKSKISKLMAELVDTERVLGAFGDDLPDMREEYRRFVEGGAPHAEQEMLIRQQMKEDELWQPADKRDIL